MENLKGRKEYLEKAVDKWSLYNKLQGNFRAKMQEKQREDPDFTSTDQDYLQNELEMYQVMGFDQ